MCVSGFSVMCMGVCDHAHGMTSEDESSGCVCSGAKGDGPVWSWWVLGAGQASGGRPRWVPWLPRLAAWGAFNCCESPACVPTALPTGSLPPARSRSSVRPRRWGDEEAEGQSDLVYIADLRLAQSVTSLATNLVRRHRPRVIDRHAVAPEVDGADGQSC